MNGKSPPRLRKTFGSFIFLSRWLQAPLYLGLIVAQSVYVYRFLLELWHLLGFALLGHAPPKSVPSGVVDTETVVMLSVLGLIDVVMIANLLIMVIVGGYETFVFCVAPEPARASGPTGVALPRERGDPEGKVGDGADRHFVNSSPQDIYQRGPVGEQDDALAGGYSCHVRGLGDCPRLDRSDDLPA
jgi:hypothetical protein